MSNDISGGGLHFTSELDNEQMNSAIDETLKRVQGLSNGTVAGGKEMDNAFNQTADSIRQNLSEIGAAIGTHENELQKLESQYQELGSKASAAFMAGRDDEYRAISKQQTAVQGEITVRKKLISELKEQSNRLEEAAQKTENHRKKTDENANAQISMRTRLRQVREEMMLLVDQGIDETSEAYQRLKNEAGRLQDIYDDVNQQARVLANDEAKFQGIISGLSGLAGGFSAATGAISLFAGENEDLQKVMTKVQSVMALTIGLQQVSQTLNKDSAFQLVTINGLKEWWRKVVTQSTVAETAETAATTANTTAQKANAAATGQATTAKAVQTATTTAQTAATAASTKANIGLAGSFRLIGTAIKSVPVFGWIVAGVSALVGAIALLSRNAREARKEMKEFSKAIVEGTYEPIGKIELLSTKFARLGNDLEAKKKFVNDNAKAFEELGATVNDVADAENLLITNKDKFVEAQIAKAKATIYLQQTNEKIKKQIELEQELAKMPDTVTVTASTGMYGNTYTYEAKNTAKAWKQQELEDLQTEIKKGYENAADEELKGLELLNKNGIDATVKYQAGTIGAIEQAISEKQAALKLLTNPEDYRKGMTEIENLQEQLNAITGGQKTTGTQKDPFSEKLERYKKEYSRFLKWANSGDETIAKAAQSEFEGLLKEGATYIDYLKKQREIILSVDVAERTKQQNTQLRMLNEQIAEETRQTVLESFNNELSNQLSNAKTTIEMLNIIEQRRKELANDGTELDNQKKEVLDEAEQSAIEKQREETERLLDEYESYLDKKIKIEQEFNDDIVLLEKALSDATSQEEKDRISRSINNRKRRFDTESQGTGDADYDSMLKAYATFEQKKQDIIDEFDEKRMKAAEHGNEQLIEQLNKAQAEALSKLAIGEMQANPDWERMFGNLDEVSTKKLQELLERIESMTGYLGIEFDPKDLEAIKNQIDNIKSEIRERNPFRALVQGVKDYGDATDEASKKAASSDMFKAASESLDMIGGAFDSVVSGLNEMGLAGDDITQQLLSDIGDMVQGASDLAMGIATGNPIQIIQGGIQLLTSAFKVFNQKDRDAERAIRRHAEAVKRLETEYNNLSRAIDKALGDNVYKNQQAAIVNMEEQRKHLRKMWEAEESKKKTDRGKVDEYRAQYEQLGYDIEDMVNGISESIIQVDARSLAKDLGDAFIDAFAAGEDAVSAFGKKADDVVANIIRNMLVQKLLEQPIGNIIDRYSNKWVNSKGDFVGFDTVMRDAGALGKDLKGIGDGFSAAMESMPEEIKKYFTGDGNSSVDTSLSGAIKGVTEQTAGALEGQMNAIRINQVESVEILRQQLMALNMIASNTSYNRFLQSIDAKLEQMSGDPLRSQGLS